MCMLIHITGCAVTVEYRPEYRILPLYLDNNTRLSMEYSLDGDWCILIFKLLF